MSHDGDALTPRTQLPFVDGAQARAAAEIVDHIDLDGPAVEVDDVETKTPALARVANILERTPAGPLVKRGRDLTDPVRIRGAVRQWQMQSRANEVDPFGLDPVYRERWRPIIEFLYRRYFEVEATGMVNVPDRGRAIIVANHAGAIPYDVVMLMYALRYDHAAHRTARPLIEDTIFHQPFLGMRLNRIGCVRACPENAERLLNDEKLVIALPEGTKGMAKLHRDRYQLRRFGRGGFVRLALRTGAPIIPTAVVGAEEVTPTLANVKWAAKTLSLPFFPITSTFPWLGPLGLLPRRVRWLIHFGEPIDAAQWIGSDASSDPMHVQQMSEHVRSEIITMIDGLRQRRQERRNRTTEFDSNV